MNEIEKTVKGLVALKRPDAALDYIYTKIDNLCLEGKFNDINTILKDLNVDSLDTNCLIGFLTICFPAYSKLPFARMFFNKVADKLSKEYDEEEVKELLSGLEPPPPKLARDWDAEDD